LLRGRNLEIKEAKLCLETSIDANDIGYTVTINGIPFMHYTEDEKLGGLPSCGIETSFTGKGLIGEHRFLVESDSSVDPDKLKDILLYFSYELQST
jgi:hypothetical protein